MMNNYEYILYCEDGNVIKNTRIAPFNRQELQNIVGGNIEILPVKIKGIQGFTNVYVVCEDGIDKYKQNKITTNN